MQSSALTTRSSAMLRPSKARVAFTLAARNNTRMVLARAQPRNPLNSITNQIQDPILRAAVKEPLAFFGGVFAGALRLNLSEDPLREWVQKTSEAALGLPPSSAVSSQQASQSDSSQDKAAQ